MKTLNKYILIIAAAMLVMPLTSSVAYAGDDVNNIKLYKTTVPTGNDDEYLITLNSFVTGAAVVTDVTKPVDLVLVLDVSTSMAASEGAEWLLSSFVKLTTGDNIGILHTTTSGTNNYQKHYTNKDRSGKGGTLRYRIKIGGVTYNLMYRNNAWYYADKTSWDSGNGWTKYDRNNATDEILTDVKIDLLQEACRVFVDQIAESAAGKDKNPATTADNIDHRIGFATFCGNLTQWCNIVPVGTNVSPNTGGSMTMEAFIGDLHNHMGSMTAPSKAFDQADTMYKTLNTALTNERKTNAEKDVRSKVTVMFTDGNPTNGVNTNLASAQKLKAGFDDGYKKGSVSADNYGKLFTVGIFSDAQQTVDGTTIENYMTYASSYYPNATAKKDLGTKNTDGVEYYQESDGSDLSAIFKSIAQAAGADTYKLTDSDAAAIDVMSNDFEIPTTTTVETISITQWVCVDGGLNHKDEDGAGVRYRGGFMFVPYKVEASAGSPGTDKIYDKDAPVASIDRTNQRISITGFNYAYEGASHTNDKGQIVVDTYGNYVGRQADGNYAGKMIEISFKVKLKPESMGGFGLPTNKTSSGIYINKGTKENPIYEMVMAYPLPVVDVPSIYILKEGLKYGESAVFTVTRKTATTKDEDGNDIEQDLEEGDDGYIKYDVILSQAQADDAPCFVVIKDLKPGNYEVKENTGWSWTYTPSTSFITTQEYNLHAPVIPSTFADMDAFKADIKSRQSASTYGATTNPTERDKEENRYYVTGSIAQDSNDTAMHLLFKFVNSKKDSSLPLNDEAFTVNVFGKGGGSAEHGGVDPEVPVGE